jgi:hypothetical protein
MTDEARCTINPFCRRPAHHKGRHYPTSAGELKTAPNGRRRRSSPTRVEQQTEPEPPAPVVANGSVRVTATELGELAELLEGRAAHLRRLASSGQTFELAEVER